MYGGAALLLPGVVHMGRVVGETGGLAQPRWYLECGTFVDKEKDGVGWRWKDPADRPIAWASVSSLHKQHKNKQTDNQTTSE